jgi:peptidyl-prolyl cis-trans isomerase D
MFLFFRKYRKTIYKWFLFLFVGVVSLSMVLTLAPIPGGDTALEQNVLAEVGGTPITTADVQRSISTRLRGSPFANDPEIVGRLAGIVLDDMILRRVLFEEAQRLGLRVTDAELQSQLRATLPFLYPDGQFVGLERYREFVAQQAGQTIPQFEAQMRETLLLEKVRTIITSGVRVSEAEIRDEFLTRNARATIEYVVLTPERFAKSVEITDEALAAHYEREKARYRQPEQRRVRYVFLDPDAVRARVQVTDDELRARYSRNLSAYRVEDRARVAHILFKTEGRTPEEIETLEKTAREVLQKAQAGADFAELARKHSEDSSAAQGGEVGWIIRGQTVAEFEKAAFSMKPGELSDLIKTTYGFHIVKVLGREDARLRPFEEVRDELREQVFKEKLSEEEQKYAQEVERALKQSPQDFEAVARKFGLTPRETEPFRYNQAVPDFGTSESFHNLAFQLRPDEVGIPITVPRGTVIIQLAEILPEQTPPLEEIRARVEEDYRAGRAAELALEKARELAAKAKEGDFAQAARAAGFTVRKSQEFTERDSVEGVGSGSQLTGAFTLPVGAVSDVVSLGTNRVVFRILSRDLPDESALAAQKQVLAEELLSRKRTMAWEIYRQSLKQQMMAAGKLRLNERGMQQFLASYQRTS